MAIFSHRFNSSSQRVQFPGCRLCVERVEKTTVERFYTYKSEIILTKTIGRRLTATRPPTPCRHDLRKLFAKTVDEPAQRRQVGGLPLHDRFKLSDPTLELVLMRFTRAVILVEIEMFGLESKKSGVDS